MDAKTKKYIEAKQRVRSIRGFYIHLIIFIAGSLSIASLLFWIDPGEYAVFWTWLILSTIISWFVGICIHAWSVFGSRIFFSKNWEERKMQEYIDREMGELNQPEDQ